MNFGLTKEQFDILTEQVIDPLKAHNLKVYIFGARATGTNHPYSDIDILFDGETNPEIEKLVSKIRSKMEESNYPFKVDLVYFPHLAKSYVDSVVQSRILV